VLTLCGGALLGSVVTWQVGSALASGRRSGAANSQIRLPLTLHATALLGAEALVAVVLYVVLIGLSGDDTLGATSDGTTLDGTAPDGTAPDGTAPFSSLPNVPN
jgi:hypothetical protein